MEKNPKKEFPDGYAILTSMGKHLSVDIGGTQLRAALFSPGNFHPEVIMRSSTNAQQSTALDRLIDLLLKVWPENEEVISISVAAPGPVNPSKGIVLNTPNIPGWNNLPLKQILEEKFRRPVLLGNDANIAALGEWKYGAGRGHHHMIYLTVSTGIGGGVIVNDQLLVGVDGLAGEFGHMTIMENGPLCGCGHHGHLEALASGTAIARWVTEQISQGAKSSISAQQKITARMVAEAGQAGDQLSITAFAQAGYYIGQALANLLHIFNPSIIVIGGGVSRSGNLLIEPLNRSLHKHVLSASYLQNLSIETAALGDEAGLIGAYALSQSNYP